MGHELLYSLGISESKSATDASKPNPVNKSDRSCLDISSQKKLEYHC